MTDRHRVCTKVKKTLKQIVELHHQGQVVTLKGNLEVENV